MRHYNPKQYTIPEELRKYRQLWAHVVYYAVADLAHVGKTGRNRDRIRGYASGALVRQRAEEFFESEDFEMICTHYLEIDPGKFRLRLTMSGMLSDNIQERAEALQRFKAKYQRRDSYGSTKRTVLL